MAYNVKFIKGTAAQYSALIAPDANTFYWTTDNGKFYLGAIELTKDTVYNDAELRGKIAALETLVGDTAVSTQIQNAIAALNLGDIVTHDADEFDEAGAADAVKEELDTKIGDLDDLDPDFDTPDDVVAALNKALALIDAGGTASVVTVEKLETPTAGYFASYSVKQGGVAVGSTINIPKDFLVKSAEVKTCTVKDQPIAGLNPGDKYIDFVINVKEGTATDEHMYLNVKDLTDVYTAAQGATQVQLAISGTNEISATLVDGGVSTDKIANKAVTGAKLDDNVNASLAKADSAMQSVTVLGTELEDGDELTVDAAKEALGLGSAAYEDTDAFATAAQGAKADTAVQAVVEGDGNGQIKVDGTNVNVHGLGSAAFVATTAFDAAGDADTAESNAKAYADSLAPNYDAAGDADAAEAAAKAYTDTALTWGSF